MLGSLAIVEVLDGCLHTSKHRLPFEIQQSIGPPPYLLAFGKWGALSMLQRSTGADQLSQKQDTHASSRAHYETDQEVGNRHNRTVNLGQGNNISWGCQVLLAVFVCSARDGHSPGRPRSRGQVAPEHSVAYGGVNINNVQRRDSVHSPRAAMPSHTCGH